jgi:hypothetical protein
MKIKAYSAAYFAGALTLGGPALVTALNQPDKSVERDTFRMKIATKNVVSISQPETETLLEGETIAPTGPWELKYSKGTSHGIPRKIRYNKTTALVPDVDVSEVITPRNLPWNIHYTRGEGGILRRISKSWRWVECFDPLPTTLLPPTPPEE